MFLLIATFTKLEARKWKEILESFIGDKDLVISLPPSQLESTIGLNITIEEDKLKFTFGTPCGWISLDKLTAKIIIQNLDFYLNSKIRHLQSVKE